MRHVIRRGRRRVGQADPKLRQSLFDLSTHINGSSHVETGPGGRIRRARGNATPARGEEKAALARPGIAAPGAALPLQSPSIGRRSRNQEGQPPFPLLHHGLGCHKSVRHFFGNAALVPPPFLAPAIRRWPTFQSITSCRSLLAFSASRPAGRRRSARRHASRTQANSRTAPCIGSTSRWTGRWWGRPPMPMEPSDPGIRSGRASAISRPTSASRATC
jgi:hypothetical protein